MVDIKKELTRIDPSKECLRFLGERIMSENYRGLQLSQHNRYDVAVVIVLLEEMYNLVGNNLMAIRTTDMSKRSYNTDEEKTYAIYVNGLSQKLKRCTQDSVRKNLFVDLHRMRFINRYDKDKNPTHPFNKTPVKYVSISRLGMELLNNKDKVFNKNFTYTKGIDYMTNGLADELKDVIFDLNQKISLDEYQFFMSFLNCELNNHYYTKTELASYISEYRSMSKFNRIAVVDIIKNYCDPNKFSGNKKQKRDYHNWRNEAQQTFMILDQTVLYEKYDDNLILRVKGENALFDSKAKINRSEKQKDLYFENHGIKKEKGFELHHIIPLMSANSKEEYALLDTWINMIYIDAYTHAIISQTNNKNIDLEFEVLDIRLKDPSKIYEDINCIKDKNVLYESSYQEEMQAYNDKVLDEIKDDN